MAPTTPPPLLADLLAGLGITVWYALPDYTGSRPLRIVAKSAILATSAVYGSAVIRRQVGAAIDGAAPEQDSEQPPTGRPEAAASPGSPSRTSAKALHPVVFPIAAAAVLGGGAAVTVGMERFVYRFGERLSSRGVHLPHSRIGLVLGVVSTAATLGADALSNRTRPAPDRSTDPV
jgi:hypothetical protein